MEHRYNVDTKVVLNGKEIKTIYDLALKSKDLNCRAAIRIDGLVFRILNKFMKVNEIDQAESTKLFNTDKFDKLKIEYWLSLRNLFLLNKINRGNFVSLIKENKKERRKINTRIDIKPEKLYYDDQ